MAQLNFDATNVPPAAAPEAIPTDWYTCQMTGSEMKPTSDNTGAYLQCDYTIMVGPYAGRKITDRINLQNKNPAAVEIGYRTLSAICHAVGVIQVADSQLLHGRPLQVRVALRPAGPGANGQFYDASNEIRGYKAVDGAAIAGAGAPAAGVPAWANQQQPAAAPAPAQQPWAQPAAPAPAQQPWAAPAPAAAPQFQPPAQQAPQFQPPVQQPAAAPAAATPPWAAAPAPAAQAPAAAPAAQPPQFQPPAAQAGGAPVPPWLQQPNG